MLDDKTFGKEELGKYHPDYKDYSELETLVENGEVEAFDYIISNAVLNVVPQDTRDNLTVAMGHLLKPGGQMFCQCHQQGLQRCCKFQPRTCTSQKHERRTEVRQEGKSGLCRFCPDAGRRLFGRWKHSRPWARNLRLGKQFRAEGIQHE